MRFLPILLIAATACSEVSAPITVEDDESAATGVDATNLGDAARVYRFTTSLARCGAWSLDEDFSSGRYNAHRFVFTAQTNSVVELQLARQRGTWSPAIVVAPGDGISVEQDLSGRTGAVDSVKVHVDASTQVYAYVTSYEMVDGRWSGSITRSAQYTFAISETCDTSGGGGSAFYVGLDRQGSHIPRAGLSNSTLRRALGLSVEPYGDVVVYEGEEYVSGTISWFGGPNDTGVTSTETGAITGERLRSLHGYFCAMRFDYTQNGVAWWGEQRLIVKNPNTGAAVIVRPVDWGPNTRTRRLVDLSQETLRALGIDTDDEAIVAFADPSAPLGPVN